MHSYACLWFHFATRFCVWALEPNHSLYVSMLHKNMRYFYIYIVSSVDREIYGCMCFRTRNANWSDSHFKYTTKAYQKLFLKWKYATEFTFPVVHIKCILWQSNNNNNKTLCVLSMTLRNIFVTPPPPILCCVEFYAVSAP